MKAPLVPLWSDERERWILSVPPGLSPTGKRQRLSFIREADGKREAKRLLAVRAAHGTTAQVLPAAQHLDATKALGLLKGRGSLVEAARFFLDAMDRRKASVTFADCWAHHMAGLETSSDRYKADVAKTGGRLCEKIGRVLVSEITPASLSEAIESLWPTATRFNTAKAIVSSALSKAVDKGWAKENPASRIKKRKTNRRDVEILNVLQARALLDACRDFRKDENMPGSLRVDCTNAAPAVAILLFAGLRPEEIARLDWAEVNLENGAIRVTGRKSKTGAARFVPIEDNLRAWLEAVPPADRAGSVTPADWPRKIKAARKAAGIGGMQDVCRHTYASMWLGAFDDVNALRARMGHSTRDVLFACYRALVAKRDAIAFWKIVPEGMEPPEMLVAAS